MLDLHAHVQGGRVLWQAYNLVNGTHHRCLGCCRLVFLGSGNPGSFTLVSTPSECAICTCCIAPKLHVGQSGAKFLFQLIIKKPGKKEGLSVSETPAESQAAWGLSKGAGAETAATQEAPLCSVISMGQRRPLRRQLGNWPSCFEGISIFC